MCMKTDELEAAVKMLESMEPFLGLQWQTVKMDSNHSHLLKPHFSRIPILVFYG